jgi:hypothetical protein
MTSAEQLYEAISIALSESLCSLFEVIGVLELAKQELVLASFDDEPPWPGGDDSDSEEAAVDEG